MHGSVILQTSVAASKRNTYKNVNLVPKQTLKNPSHPVCHSRNAGIKTHDLASVILKITYK